jgi:broad specificity phosphatase PhoE
MLARGARSMLVVAHKGVLRTIVEKLCGEPLHDGQPDLGGMVHVTRGSDGHWSLGRRSSDPRA